MTMNSRLLKFKYWLDWLAPNRCPVCRKVIMWNELICKSCLDKLPYLEDKHVDRCENNISFVCSLFEYFGEARKGIMNLKLHDGVNFAEYSTAILCDYIKEKGIADDIDLITAVPMRGIIKRDRGYNQAEIIAKYVGRYLNKPTDYKLISCTKSKLEQHKLTKKERQENAVKAYLINTKHSDITGKNILICDDIITTGATLSACAEILKSMGASKVFALTVCSTNLYDYKE